MQASPRNFVALALATALATPMAFAQATGGHAVAATKHAAATTTTPAKAPVAVPTPDPAADAVTAATTQLESRGGATVSQSSDPAAPAQPPMGSGATGSSDADTTATTGNPGRGNWWIDADTDADGRLSATEAVANAGLHSRFAAIDANADGFVTQEEYRTFFAANASLGAQHAAGHSLVVTRDLWLKLDADADSRISVSEAASDTAVSGAFSAVDSNRDGFVTQDEYRAYAKANPH